MTSSVGSYTGAAIVHRSLGGATATRVMHMPCQQIAPHRHDWPVLTLYRLGAYREIDEYGEELLFDGPGLILHPAGALHSDVISDVGLETLSISFDPDWLEPEMTGRLPRRSQWCTGGMSALTARKLANAWLDPMSDEKKLCALTSQLLGDVIVDGNLNATKPAWLKDIREVVDDQSIPTRTLANRFGMHPAWLARAYRLFNGEGIGETRRRRQVERAMTSLRNDDSPLAEIAVETGFCDQSHMNRCFKDLLGRTPRQVRQEKELFTAIAC